MPFVRYDMAKRNKTEEFSVQSSMLFEKNDRKADELKGTVKDPKKRKKLVTTIVILVFVVFIAVPWLIVTILKPGSQPYKNDGTPKSSYSELLAKTTATEKSTELFGMKNPDLKDKESVESLIKFLQLEEQLGGYTVEVQSDTKPYSLTLKFNLTHDVPADGYDMWEQTVIRYSCAILSLVNNISQVNWEYPVTNATAGAYFTRTDAEKLYNLGVTAVTFAKSPESVQLMLNQLGIDLY